MKDLLIICVDVDCKLGKELSNELKLLGVRTSLLLISNIENLNESISNNIKKYSAILLFITENFSNKLIENKISVKTKNKKVISLSFKLKKKILNSLKKQIKNIVVAKDRALSQYVLTIINEMNNEKRRIKLIHSNKIEDIWDSPLCLYQKKENINSTREILLDVAWSANPTNTKMAPALASSLRQTFEYMKGKKPFDIMDFGAGKLRHTVILLEGGHRLTAVEYPEIFHNPAPAVKKLVERARKHIGRYDKITYPNELITLNKTHDLIMLINVIDIIPEPLERFFVLDQCNKKLKKGGYLLWFTQYGDADQRDVVSDPIVDGGCTIKQTRKTFYTEFDKDTVNLMLALMGFRREPIKLESGSNQAWLYKKISEPIINTPKIALKLRRVIERKIHLGKNNDTIIADLLDAESFVTIGDILYYDLSVLETGKRKKVAYKYEKLIKQIINYIFKNNFKVSVSKTQYPLHKGKIKIDLRADWRENSTFKAILDSHNLNSTFVPIECKNYTEDIGNPELGQIFLRHHKDYRHFGIMTCRAIKDSEKIKDSLYVFYNDHGFLVIILDDEDMKTLLKLRDEEKLNPPWIPRDIEEPSEGWMIAEYIKKRIEEVVYNNKREDCSKIYEEIKIMYA